MKPELKAKFLQHLNKKNQDKGFTLIELLVVVIIIGILAAVALPSMLSQANKAREAGAQSQLGSINRAQQAYRLENTTFASDYTALGLSDPNTKDYNIAIAAGTAELASAQATPIDSGSGLSNYSACVSQTSGTTTAALQKGDTCSS